MIRLTALFALLFFPASFVWAQSDMGLVLSEFSVDQVPGVNGSWIELYNSSSLAVEGKSVSIVCNGTTVAHLPSGYQVGPRRFAIIRFDKDCKKLDKKIYGGVTHFRLPVVNHKFVSKKYPLPRPGKNGVKKGVGYVALFLGEKLNKGGLNDFAAWGKRSLVTEFIKQTGVPHMGWAEEKGLWKSTFEIRTGVAATWEEQLSYGFLKGNCFLSRRPFLSDKRLEGWAVVSADSTTPGAANQWIQLAPILHLGKKSAATLEVVFDSRMKLLLGTTDRKVFRLQVAEDPYFRKLIVDDLYANGDQIPDSVKKATQIYYRLRIEAPEINSDWSWTQFK